MDIHLLLSNSQSYLGRVPLSVHVEGSTSPIRGGRSSLGIRRHARPCTLGQYAFADGKEFANFLDLCFEGLDSSGQIG